MHFKLRSKRKSAFSLIEISIVILIIGVIVAGVVQGSRMMKKARLTSARSATVSAPVNFLKDLSGWYDTVSEASFKGVESDDKLPVSQWNSIAKTSSDSVDVVGTQGTPANRPTYVDGGISSLPQLLFDGTKSIVLQDGSFPSGNSPYTVFIVANPLSGGTVLSSGSGSNVNSMGFDAGGNFTVDGGTGNGGFFSASTTGNNLQIVTHSYDGTVPSPTTNKVWVNGTVSTINSVSGAGSAKSTGTGSVSIGGTVSGFNGKLGELIIFNRALEDDERQDVERYLAKKWGLKTGNAVLNSAAVCNVSGVGVAANSTVTQGAYTIACNASGYHGTGTLSATCATNGSNLTATGCVADSSIVCNVTFAGSITGSATTVIYGASTVACPSGYSGTAILSGNCSTNGQSLTASSGCTLTTLTCTTAAPGAAYSPSTSQTVTSTGSNPYTCAVGYYGDPTYSCTTNGATNIAVSGCNQNCNAATVTNGTVGGYSNSVINTNQYAHNTTATLTCDGGAGSLTGSATGTCSNGSWTGFGTCAPVQGTATGGTITYVCDGAAPSATACSAGTTTKEKIHTFTSSGAFTITGNSISNIQYLIVAGGGGGGGDRAGGGGAGGLRTSSGVTLSPNPYTITVGSGGAGGNGIPRASSTNRHGATGGLSSIAASGFTTVSADGGGGGGTSWNDLAIPTYKDGRPGGSGGGGGLYGTNGAGGSPTGNGLGSSGGSGYNGNAGGGGGGAGGTGSSASNGVGGAGGAGYTSSVSGTSVCYAGGGGGGSSTTKGSAAVGCGGGNGGKSSATATLPVVGTANSGGGGGGGGDTQNGVAGGSGIVIIRYQY